VALQKRAFARQAGQDGRTVHQSLALPQRYGASPPSPSHTTFAPDTAAAVAQLAEAERLCCPDIRWALTETPALQVQITARRGQLAIFESFLPQWR